jgi:exosome complex component CSL4
MSREAPEVVVPGEYLGVAEEFLPGPGAYEFDYRLRAAVIGQVVRDRLSKVVSVRPFKVPRLPQQGAIVVAVITEVREDFARSRIFTVNNTPLSYTFTGILHAAQIAERASEVKQIYEHLKIGDLVRARVLNRAPPYLLSTRDPKLGVVLASCSKCGATLRLAGDKLVCPQCGNTEKRKIAQGYGKL